VVLQPDDAGLGAGLTRWRRHGLSPGDNSQHGEN